MIPGTSVIPRIEISGPPNNDVHKAPSLKPHDGSPEVPEAIIKSPTCVDRNEYLKKKVGALFETYTNAKKLELSVLTLIEANFSGNFELLFSVIQLIAIFCPMYIFYTFR